MNDPHVVARRLSSASVKRYSNPYAIFDWPEQLDKEQWYFSPELMSIYHTSVYEDLTETQQKKLSFYEALNFFSLNIHGEKSLLQGLATRLYGKWPAEITEYLHHFLDEENKHMSVFGEFCLRYGGKVYPSKQVSITRPFAPGEEDFLFFVRVVIFEEFVDYFNYSMSKDARLHPLIQAINRYHHEDEIRHLAFGRTIAKKLFDDYSPQWDEETLVTIRNYLAGYIEATWREYYNPNIYKDAGLHNSYDLYELAWNSERGHIFRQQVSNACIEYLSNSNILLGEPTL